MKKITLLISVFILLTCSWHGYTQTLNEPAGWPNAGWTITGTYNADPTAFEADPTVSANFAYDDDDSGSGIDDDISAESPVYDLTAAHTAGETWINLNADYFYYYLANDQFQVQYWDVDAASWTLWGDISHTGNGTTDDFCTGSKIALDITHLDIASFTATQLTGFKYRLSYDDDITGADWNFGFCFDAPTLSSVAPPACPNVVNLDASNFSGPGSSDLTWDTVTGATGYNWEIQPQGTAQGDAALVEGGNVASNMASATSLVDGTDYTLYVQSDCGGGVTGNYVSFDFTFIVPLVNDDCSGVIDLGTLMSPHSASTVGANNSFSQDCLTNVAAPDVIYSVLVPDGYILDIQQDSNSYDSKHRLAYGATCPGDMLIACTDDPDTNPETWTNNTGTDQTVYWIQSAFSTGSGDYTLSWSVNAPPACPDVTNIAVANFVSPGSADLTWDVVTGATAYNWEIQPQGTAQGDAALVEGGNVATNMASATSLVDGTDYTLYIQSDCGGAQGNYVSFDFTFAIPPVNDTLAGAIPIVPSPEGTGCSTFTFIGHAAGDGTTDSGLDGSCNGTDTGLDVFFSWTATSDALIWNDGDGNPGIVIRDAAGTEITCQGTFGPIDTELSGWAIGDDLIIQIYDYATADVNVAFCLEEYNFPSCPDVENLSAGNFSAPGSGDLAWDVVVEATSYNWEIQPQGTAQGDAALVEGGNVATNMASATSLVDGTDYTLYVQSDCGGGDTGEYVSFDFTFILPPVNDDCSGVIDLGTLMSPHSATTAGANNNFDQDCLTNAAAPDVVYSLVVPDGYTVDIGQDSNAYDSKHRLAYGTSCPGDMSIDCIDDGDTDRITWQNTTGMEQTVYWIQSAYSTGSGDYVLSWTLTPPPCSDPTDLTAMNITESSADLGWTVGADGETMWDVEWGAVGFAAGTGAELGSADNTMDNPLNVTGLTASTDYEFYVKAVCFATVESAWVGPFAFSTLAPPPPANDNVCDAIEIIVDADSAGDAFTDELATAEANEVIGSCFNGDINGSVWFTFVAPVDGAVQITTDIAGGTHSDTEIAVYEAPTDCADASSLGAELGCDQDGGDIVGFGYMSYLELTGLTAGNTYYIQVDRWGTATTGTFGLEVNTPPACPDVANLSASNFLAAGTADLAWDASAGAVGYNWEIQPQGTAQGTAGAIDMGNTATNMAVGNNMVADGMYTLYVQSDCDAGALGNYISIDFTFILAPANDDCANAIALTVGTSRNDNVVMGNNTSTTDSGEVAPACASYAGGDMWYSAVVPANGNMIVETFAAAGDGGLAVYSGTCGAITELACSDDDGEGLYGLIELTGLTPGDTLLIRVWEYGNNAVIDFNVVAYSPLCDDVANLSASNFVAPGSADLAWDEIVGVAGYNWEIQPQGTAQGTAGAIDMGNVATNMASTSMLVDGTAYTLYVQSDCGMGALGNYIAFDFTFNLPPANDLLAGATPIVPSAEGTGCTTFTFQNHLANDGTTDSGVEGSCLTGNEGLDRFYTWTATSNGLLWNDGDGNPGIIIWDTMGNELACEGTFAADDVLLSGWNVGDDLIIQVYDFAGANVDVSFCLEEYNILVSAPDCASNFMPVDGSIDLVVDPLDITFSWDAPTTGDAPDSYNFYYGFDAANVTTLLGNYTDTTVQITAPNATTIYWMIVPVNDGGEATGCSIQSFTTMDTAADTDGDGVDNGTEADPNADGDQSDATDMYDSCDPVQAPGYTGYDSANPDWLGSDCDGDGQDNETEFLGGSDPYDDTSVVSVEDLEAVGFTYYPNPVKDELTMTANENIKVVSIFNTLGQEVLRVEPSTMETKVNVARLANGTYFVKAEVGDAVGTFKVVKN